MKAIAAVLGLAVLAITPQLASACRGGTAGSCKAVVARQQIVLKFDFPGSSVK
jgi:hypothetical protein